MSKMYLDLIRREYEEEFYKVRNRENIRQYFDMTEEKEYTLDDQTWSDLDMDNVYERLDRNYSSLGEASLYHMLRNPLMDEDKLQDRSNLIELFKTDNNLRERLQCIFFNLHRDKKNSFLDMVENDLVVNKIKYYLYTVIGKVIPFILIILAIFVDISFMLVLLGLSVINMLINSRERGNIKANGIFYLRKIIKSAKRVSGIKSEGIADHTEKIRHILKQIKDLDRNTRMIGFVNLWEGVFESLSVIFLLEEGAYYGISRVLKEKKQLLMDLYYTLGELEALISIAGFQYNLKQQYTKPKFSKEITINIKDAVHPLIDEPVANSIEIKNKGIVLTGTNMSGKSTFLRMLGVNILLAQTFNFVLAEEYEASFFNIVTSISPSDDLTKGKSFFMAEVESIQRIINAVEKEVPVFCPIDEIFRGTNPTERIAMSAEILTYLNCKKTISMVATHDRELADILREAYEFYYFSEDVDSSSGLSFDYKLKKGISQTRNAIKLLEYMNYPKEIVENAYKRAETIKGFI
jgi:DNA mismatch repair ATPase MutS